MRGAAEEGLDDGLAALSDWYWQQCLDKCDEGNALGLVVEETDDAALWMTFDLLRTALAGCVVEPFVDDRGSGRWLQGWSDGERLSLAFPARSHCLALVFLEELTTSLDDPPKDWGRHDHSGSPD